MVEYRGEETTKTSQKEQREEIEWEMLGIDFSSKFSRFEGRVKREEERTAHIRGELGKLTVQK